MITYFVQPNLTRGDEWYRKRNVVLSDIDFNGNDDVKSANAMKVAGLRSQTSVKTRPSAVSALGLVDSYDHRSGL